MKLNISDLLDSLTINDALKYDALVDKVVWIQDTFLDPNDLDRDWWSAVEETLIDILEAKREQNQKVYGIKYLDEFVAGIENSLVYKLSGGLMSVASLMSDAQEQMAAGDVEGARQTLNLGKYLLTRIMEGKLVATQERITA